MRGKNALSGVALAVATAAGAVGTAPAARVYGYDNIKRTLRKWGRSRQQGNSPASYDHEHAREKARHLRQAKRDAENRERRALAAFGYLPKSKRPDALDSGLSRRGRWVAL